MDLFEGLHQHAEDLTDTLHDIASQRKVESEKERETIMTHGWVPDHLGLLTSLSPWLG